MRVTLSIIMEIIIPTKLSTDLHARFIDLLRTALRDNSWSDF
jgi:hypothetical protein